MKANFVNWDCGCMGIKLPFGDVVIWHCDGDWEDPGPHFDLMRTAKVAGKASTPLTEAEVRAIVGAVGSLIQQGKALDEVRHLLRLPPTDPREEP
jgi:hypothetical protein